MTFLVAVSYREGRFWRIARLPGRSFYSLIIGDEMSVLNRGLLGLIPFWVATIASAADDDEAQTLVGVLKPEIARTKVSFVSSL